MPDTFPMPVLSLHDTRLARARRGEPMDADELTLLRRLADGARRPTAPEGCHTALHIRGYAAYDTADGWRITQQGEWYLARVGQYAIPMHEIDRLIGEADRGCTNLIRGVETPAAAAEALAEARDLLEQATVKVREALAVVERPVTAQAAE